MLTTRLLVNALPATSPFSLYVLNAESCTQKRFAWLQTDEFWLKKSPALSARDVVFLCCSREEAKPMLLLFGGRFVFGRRGLAGFQLANPLFQQRQLFAGAQQNLRLHVKLFAAYHVKARQL